MDMPLESLHCPNCGGKEIDLNHEGSVADPYVCEICGSQLTLKDNAFHIMIDNNPTQKSLLERTRIELSAGNYSNAEKSVDRLLDIDPKCAEAYMLRLCAQRQAKDIVSLGEQPYDLSKSADYQTALRFADDRQKAEWQELARKAQVLFADAQERARIARERASIASHKRGEIAQLQARLNERRKEQKSLKEEVEKLDQAAAKTGIISSILMSVFGVGYMIIGAFGGVAVVICAIVAFLFKMNFFKVLFAAAGVIVIGLIVFGVIVDAKDKSSVKHKRAELHGRLTAVEDEIARLEENIRGLEKDIRGLENDVL